MLFRYICSAEKDTLLGNARVKRQTERPSPDVHVGVDDGKLNGRVNSLRFWMNLQTIKYFYLRIKIFQWLDSFKGWTTINQATLWRIKGLSCLRSAFCAVNGNFNSLFTAPESWAATVLEQVVRLALATTSADFLILYQQLARRPSIQIFSTNQYMNVYMSLKSGSLAKSFLIQTPFKFFKVNLWHHCSPLFLCSK